MSISVVVILEFDTIVDLVKKIAQRLRDNVEAAIISTRESNKHFADLLDRQEREQHDINEIDMWRCNKQLTG